MDLMTRRRALLAQAQEPGVLATATGNPMAFTTNLARPLHSLVIPFSPVQAAGTPSPDNPLPISGWTGVNVYNETAYNASATPKLTINWQTEAGTIYGGTVTLYENESVDVVSTMAIVDLGDYTYTYNSGSLRFDMSRSTLLGAKPIGGNDVPNAYCTQYLGVKFNGNYGSSGLDMSFFFDNRLLRIRDKRYTDATAFKTALAGVKLCYELATPQTYHFDNIGQLYTYLGTNTIWTDTNGTNTAEYWIKNT